jgi:membrane fusion protein, copper/silver efflux system
MSRLLKAGLSLGAAAVIAAGSYRLGAGSWPDARLGAVAVPGNPQASADRRVLYWRHPDGKPEYSATAVKTTDGRDYVPVYEDQEPTLPGEKPLEAKKEVTQKAEPGERKPIYYRNPMGFPDTSPVPKKDPMGMDYIPVYEGEDDTGGIKISPEKIQRSGVHSEEVGKRILGRTVRAPGIVALDERRISVVALRFDSYLEKVEDVTTGSHVKAGEPLMAIYAPDVVKIGGRLVVEQETGWGPTAPANRATLNERSLRTPAIGARRLLENMQVPGEYIDSIVRTHDVPNTLVWRAPRDGLVLERKAVEGMRAQAGDELFRIADHSAVWVIAEVPEGQLGAIKTGQTVTIRAHAHPGREFHGKVDVVYPHLMKETRTSRVRIELPNPDLLLLPDMYADVEIETGADQPVIAVPNSAIIDSGKRQVVILDTGNGRFAPREVKVGQRGDGFSEVIDGVKVGDKVVIAANFLIDAESNLRAALKGFAAEEPRVEGKARGESGSTDGGPQ